MAYYVKSYTLNNKLHACKYNAQEMLLLIQDYRTLLLLQKRSKENSKCISYTSSNKHCFKCKTKNKNLSAIRTVCKFCSYSGDTFKNSSSTELLSFSSSFSEVESLKKTKRSTISPITVSTGNINFYEPVTHFTNSNIQLNYLAVPHPIFWQTGFVLKLVNLLSLVVNLQKQKDEVIKYIQDKWAQKIAVLYKSKKNKPPKIGVKIDVDYLKVGEKTFFESYLFRLYRQLQEENLNYGSLLKRKQGKNANEQKLVLAKRCINTGRAMITPDPSLKANQITLPIFLYQSLISADLDSPISPLWVLINRMPSLFPENITAHQIHRVTNENTIGLPLEVVFGHNADFDGDEVNIYCPKEAASQLEIACLMNPALNLYSLTMPNRCKLQPSRDVMQMFYLITHFPKKFSSFYEPLDKVLLGFLKLFYPVELNELLFLIAIKYDQSICFNVILKLSKLFFKFSKIFFLSFSMNELYSLETDISLQHDPQIIQKLVLSKQGLSFLLNSKVTTDHIEQCCLSLGLQFWPSFLKTSDIISEESLKSNFLKGLSPFDQLVHSQSSYSNMISSSKDVWIPGYRQKKLCHFLTDTVVNKNLSLKEKNELILESPLQYTFPKHVTNELYFKSLFEFISTNKD